MIPEKWRAGNDPIFFFSWICIVPFGVRFLPIRFVNFRGLNILRDCYVPFLPSASIDIYQIESSVTVRTRRRLKLFAILSNRIRVRSSCLRGKNQVVKRTIFCIFSLEEEKKFFFSNSHVLKRKKKSLSHHFCFYIRRRRYIFF